MTPPPPPPMPPVWGRRAAGYAATWGVLLCAMSIRSAIRAEGAAGAGGDAPPLFLLIAAAIGLAAGLAIASYIVHPHPGLRWREVLGIRAGPWRSALRLLLGLLAGAVLALPVWLLLALSSRILGPLGFGSDPQPAILELLDPTAPTATVAALAVSAILIAPAAEEILYRALLFGGLAAQGRPVRAAVLASLFFAALHLSVPLVLPLFALGLALCALWRQWGLPASIGAHAGFNAANALLALLLRCLAD